MDFLLECIGFPPDHDYEELARLARRHGEPVAWRGPSGEHLRLALGEGLDLRLDRETGSEPWTLSPHFQSRHRVRMAVESLREVPGSPYDVLVSGWANPPMEGDPSECPEAYPLSVVITDGRRLPRRLEPGRVLAVTIAGFALDVEYVGPEAGPARDGRRRAPRGRVFADGGWIGPLGGAEDPGGCVELSLAILNSRSLRNPLTDAPVTLLEADTPGKPLVLFTSPWQLACDDLPAPREGWRVEGCFLLTGRVTGGLDSPVKRLGRRFG